jgi:hypothetical protein
MENLLFIATAAMTFPLALAAARLALSILFQMMFR